MGFSSDQSEGYVPKDLCVDADISDSLSKNMNPFYMLIKWAEHERMP